MRATYKGEGAMVFLAARKTANYVKNNSSPSSRIAVLGSEPEIYFYANRHSATGYIYMYALTARQTYTARMRQQMIQEIETCHPDLLVYVDDRDSWNYVDASAPQVVALLSWAQEYMQNQYERVGVVDIGESIQYVWGDAARTYRPRSDKAMYVLRRKVE
jgi:DNA modification methylase